MARFYGPYEPKFRNIFHFKNQKDDSIYKSTGYLVVGRAYTIVAYNAGDDFTNVGSSSNASGVTFVATGTTPASWLNGTVLAEFDLSFRQVTFNPTVPGFGYIKNFGYLKVANTDVLTLSKNTKYPPRYPLLNETAIDRMDFPVYLSNWDPGFWRKFINKSTYKHQAGTREMLEQKSFLSTKVMKTPKQIALQTFEVAEVADVALVDQNNLPAEVTYSYSSNAAQVTRVTGYVDIRARLTRYLIDDGASAEFAKYLMPEFGVGDPDGLDDDVVAYLELNVLPTFEVKVVRPHVKLYKDGAVLPIVDGSLDDAEKLQERYVPVKEFTTNKISDFLYRFEYAVPDGQNVSIALSFDVGKI